MLSRGGAIDVKMTAIESLVVTKPHVSIMSFPFFKVCMLLGVLHEVATARGGVGLAVTVQAKEVPSS